MKSVRSRWGTSSSPAACENTSRSLARTWITVGVPGWKRTPARRSSGTARSRTRAATRDRGGPAPPAAPPPLKALTFLARRFVAGETASEAVAVGRKLQARGVRATFDLLGEDVLDREAARRTAEASKALLRLVPSEVERNISIKLSSMGQEISRDFCLGNAASILEE